MASIEFNGYITKQAALVRKQIAEARRYNQETKLPHDLTFRAGIHEYFESNLKYEGDCWIWTGYMAGPGFPSMTPRFTLAMDNIGELVRITTPSRYALAYYKNVILPDRWQVGKTCQNIFCCNPEHLFIGTRAEVMKRSVSFNKRDYGKRLSAETANAIRDEYANSKVRLIDLRKKYGISYKCVYEIINYISHDPRRPPGKNKTKARKSK
jgi:hypothetical protein